MNKTLQNYKSQIKPVWCPGCGNYAVLRALQQAFLDLNLSQEEILMVSGIGCSGRMSHYLNSYSLHGTHGRAVPTALGVKAARPDLTVLAVGGDGDGLGIGGGHISHAARKNVDITYILMDNRVYGLTKGQASPTTPSGQKTKTSPYGVSDLPMNPIPIFITYDISFVARSASTQIPEMINLLKKAIQHEGMSLVYVFSPCATFPILTYSDLREMLQPLPKDHPKDNKMAALERAYSQQPVYTGIFCQDQRPTLEEHLTDFIKEASPQDEPAANKWSLVKKLFEDYS